MDEDQNEDQPIDDRPTCDCGGKLVYVGGSRNCWQSESDPDYVYCNTCDYTTHR